METPIQETLSDVIKQVLNKKRNKKARKLFTKATKDLKPANCVVKIGWITGDSIGFVCMFKKKGQGEIFSEIEKGIKNPDEIKHFIYGLNPKIFHFNPKMFFDEIKSNQLFLEFKLIRNESEK